MRNFGSIVASAVLVGSWVASPAGAAEITLDAGPTTKWIFGTQVGNPTIPLVAGDVLVIRQSDPDLVHGFAFDDGQLKIPLCDPAPPAGTTFCLINPYGAKIPALSRPPAPPVPPHGEIMRLRVLQAIAADMAFHCTQHGGLMTGTVKRSQ
jgi:hypothetical protein